MAKPIPKLRYDDIDEGDEAPSASHALKRKDLIAYAAASGDHNPMHTDEVAATKSGLPSVFGHGMFTMGFLATTLTDWAGIGNLARYSVRFTKQTWPGETLTTKIVVTGKSQGEDGKRIEADVSVANQDGEVKVAGSATLIAA
jgi:acyl dehydratase